MRIWSLHPKYLDAKGLVALWRETLLAKHVLEGSTRGYKHHPQLHRFQAVEKPLDALNQYLSVVWEEAQRRNYHFDKDKINWNFKPSSLPLTQGQLDYEMAHLLKKLQARNPGKYEELIKMKTYEAHPLFHIIKGDIEPWEIIKNSLR